VSASVRIAKMSDAAQSLGVLAPVVVALLRFAAQVAARRTRHSYETLSLDITLDLADRKGRTAHLRREQEVRFLAEEAGVVRDLVWGDGDVLAGYRASGAEMVDVRREGMKQVVWLGLPDRPARGERATVRSTRTIRNGFCGRDEFLETEVERPTERLRVTVTFPESRPPREASVVASPPIVPVRRLRVRYDLGPRPYVQWKANNPRPLTRYRLRWTW
jgi:hypothetical protein